MTIFIVFGVLADIAGTALVIVGAINRNLDLIGPGAILLVIGTIFWLVGIKTRGIMGGQSLRSMMRGASGIKEGGIPARAVVQSIGETGMTINEAPVFSFDLEVHREGQPPYPVKVKQLVPRMLVGAVLPGYEVTVQVDPADPSRVGIDWSEMPRPAGTGMGAGLPAPGTFTAAAAGVPAAELADAVRSLPPERRGSAAELLARGRRGTARILGARAMGTAGDLGAVAAGDPRAGDQVLLLDLEVKLPGMDPYPASVLHRVPTPLLGKVGPGLEVPVAVGRDDPEREVAVDWEALEPG
ncbi:MAG: hypothetical protein FJW79_06200 [Actinobacteria bacterium]|nr:hypothetical protein [Actinomycetota bacterium]